MTSTSLLCLATLLSAAAGCMSAETSEASQLTRLEHGIDVSTTPPDHFTSRGELPGDGKPDESTPARAEPIAAAPTVVPSEAEPTATQDTTDDTGPRPTIRVWGAPNGGHGAPGFVPVSRIVFDAESNDPPGTKPAK